MIATRCVDESSVPVVPKWPALDPDRMATQQLAAADEAYIARLERYAARADALLIGCATQPVTDRRNP